MTIAQEPDARPVTAFTVPEMASVLGVSPRRIRQMRENGELLACGRGLIDASHGIHATMGSRVLGQSKAHVSSFTKAAAGWLMGFQSCGVRPEDLDIWFAAALEWGLNNAQAKAALFNAARMLGANCPTFHDKDAP